MKLKAKHKSSEALNHFQKWGSFPGPAKSPLRKSPHGSASKNAADLKCEKIKKELNDLKIDLGKECDDILGKIDQILDT